MIRPPRSAALKPMKRATIRTLKMPITEKHPLIAHIHGIPFLFIPATRPIPKGKNMPITNAMGAIVMQAIRIRAAIGRCIVDWKTCGEMITNSIPRTTRAARALKIAPWDNGP